MENKPDLIAAKASSQAQRRFSGDDLSLWAWTEPSVWTNSMLATLNENSVRAGKWHSLMDKVHRQPNLYSAYREVAANKGAAGVDNITIEDFTARLEGNIDKLEQQLRDGSYVPQSIKRVHIPKPGTKETRPLGIPTVRDRVVQNALRHVIEPILERQFAEHSYGFRPNRGCKDALRRVDMLLKQGYVFTVDVDLKSYFDTIPHGRLIAELRKYVADNTVIELVEKFLQADVMDGMERWTPTSGAPQGAIISPLLSNLYLNALDHHMASAGYQMTRYADDLVIQCRTLEEAQRALALVKTWTDERGLTLHPTKTKIVNSDVEGFEFLGYRFIKHRRFPRRKSLAKFKETIRQKTRRTNGNSLQATISDVNRTLRGWFEYFKHSWRTVFRELDGWIRMRLRSILRKRVGRRGRGHGLDHQRYPNSLFASLGLFDMTTAHARQCQPCCK
ncbi:MAG: group II intron reverse transcriptase/maturase [Pirellulaceae bacterium]|nr:group II intron reverse transcriptase/maturase [Pirellulaceae bacterium]